MNNLGEKLKELREEKAISQMKLSKIVGITQAAIARYELNITEPKASDIKKFCLFFGVSSDYLIGLEDEAGSKIYNNYGIHNGNVKF